MFAAVGLALVLVASACSNSADSSTVEASVAATVEALAKIDASVAATVEALAAVEASLAAEPTPTATPQVGSLGDNRFAVSADGTGD